MAEFSIEDRARARPSRSDSEGAAPGCGVDRERVQKEVKA